MNSKKKNKNRQNKPPNPSPPQKKEESIQPASSPEEITSSVVEERVPNIISENVSVEVKLPEDIPKKPKRNRGKNKKDADKSDKNDEVLPEEPAEKSEILPVKDEVVDVDIAPTARNKKNKNKKNKEEPQEESKIEVKEVETEIKVTVDESAIKCQEMRLNEETERETKSSKKKNNKKKKNRNDSEKSEKEEVTCTSGFDKLIAENDQLLTKTTDDSNVSDANVKAVAVPTQYSLIDTKPHEDSQREEIHKNKKKNKKDKKMTPADVPKSAENIQEPETIKTEEIITSCDSLEEPIVKENVDSVPTEKSCPVTSDADEKSPKLKAKIAKPVDKKKTGKEKLDTDLKENVEKVETKKNTDVVEREPTVTTMPSPILEVIKPTDGPSPSSGLLTSIIGSLPVVDVAATAIVPSTSGDVDLLPFVTLDDSDLQENTSTNLHEEVKLDEGNGPLIGCEENIDPNLTVQNGNQDKIKKRKKSPKPQRRSGTVVSPNISMQMLSEHDESSVINEINTSSLIPPPTELIIDEQTTVEPQLIQVLDEKIEHDVSASNNEKEQKPEQSHKSPKPLIKSEISSDPTQPGESKTHEELKLEETIALEPSEYKTRVSIEEAAVRKDESEHIKRPDHQKRKKSPKPQINTEISSGSKGKTEKVKKDVINIEDIIIIQAEVVSDEKAKQDDVFVASECDIETQEDIGNRKANHSKKSSKRKKSPKPPQKEITEQKPAADMEVIESEAKIQMPITPNPDDIKISSDIIPMEQEASKVGTSTSPSDISPDFIEYPRSSSEQLVDTNNNMVIQEISNVHSKLTVPIVIPDTPFAQNAELTPTELDLIGIKVMKKETVKKPTDERTDLKSKVMEVNQDMEELRLSIERSLAELTSLDQIDKETSKDQEKKDNVDETQREKATSDTSKHEKNLDSIEKEDIAMETKESHLQTGADELVNQEPICPERKDRKGKGKSKKKGKQDGATSSSVQSSSTVTDTKASTQSQDVKKDDCDKSDQKSHTTQEKGKQQSSEIKENNNGTENTNPIVNNISTDFEPIENFEDAMTSSVDDVNKTFEIIANAASPRLDISQNNPEINIIEPQENSVSRQDKKSPVSPPKNLLGHPDIPVPSSKTDYKKEKNKAPNNRQAKVKIRDCNQVEIEIDKSKQSKESQTENKRKFPNSKNANESICVTNKNEDYVYKYSFRKVFLPCACHVCKKDLAQTRVPCTFCNLIFYCSQRHKDEDYVQHQALCFAVSTIVNLKNQKFMYADALNVTGYNYRLLRMQAIVSCEKVLKRRLAPWEQEALLYPRICADPACREWRQGMLEDCEGCGQISYCSGSEHLPKSHARWCKSYNLYRSLVRHQQMRGRLEPTLPTRVIELSPLPDNINEVLAAMYEERIDINDIEYAALTQLATAPLTALCCLQAYNKTNSTVNGLAKKTLTLHIVGAELQFEADVLNKWEVFLLHLVPAVNELRVVLVGPDLNPSNLPLDLLGKIRLCNNCQQNKRRVIFSFQDKRTYHDFWASDDFTAPDLVCAFNPSIQRSSAYNGKDTWPSTISCILKQKSPFVITAYTLSELTSDLLRIQECARVGYSVVYPPKANSFASVRPDRNFISDDEAPLLFKNQCVTVLCGV